MYTVRFEWVPRVFITPFFFVYPIYLEPFTNLLFVWSNHAAATVVKEQIQITFAGSIEPINSYFSNILQFCTRARTPGVQGIIPTPYILLLFYTFWGKASEFLCIIKKN